MLQQQLDEKHQMKSLISRRLRRYLLIYNILVKVVFASVHQEIQSEMRNLHEWFVANLGCDQKRNETFYCSLLKFWDIKYDG